MNISGIFLISALLALSANALDGSKDLQRTKRDAENEDEIHITKREADEAADAIVNMVEEIATSLQKRSPAPEEFEWEDDETSLMLDKREYEQFLKESSADVDEHALEKRDSDAEKAPVFEWEDEITSRYLDRREFEESPFAKNDQERNKRQRNQNRGSNNGRYKPVKLCKREIDVDEAESEFDADQQNGRSIYRNRHSNQQRGKLVPCPSKG